MTARCEASELQLTLLISLSLSWWSSSSLSVYCKPTKYVLVGLLNAEVFPLLRLHLPSVVVDLPLQGLDFGLVTADSHAGEGLGHGARAPQCRLVARVHKKNYYSFMEYHIPTHSYGTEIRPYTPSSSDEDSSSYITLLSLESSLIYDQVPRGSLVLWIPNSFSHYSLRSFR